MSASNYFKIKNGLNVQPGSSTVSGQGDVDYNSGTNQLEVYTTGVEAVTTASNTQTFTNKSLSSSQVSDATSNATASVIVSRDSNANTRANNFIDGYATTATAGSTTTLTVASAALQYFTGSTTQTVQLPVTSTLVLGQQFTIVNLSSGTVTVNSSGSNAVATLTSNTQTTVTCILTSGTSAASWSTSATSSGVLPVPSGGTGQSSLTAHDIIVGNGTSAVTLVAPSSTSGVPLISNGSSADPSYGTAVVAGGGTGVTSVTISPTASSFAGWDANKNLSANSLIEGFRTQATANSTLTLVVGDAFQQYFTGSTSGQIVKLPTTSIVAGQSYLIVNLSTQTVTVQSSGANTIQAMGANTQLLVTAVVATPTTAANWNATYQTSAFSAPVNPSVQTFTIGSGTYTTPTGVQFIRVRMVGGGGGGGGSGTGGGGTGGTGGTSSFGTSMLTTNGGVGGTATQGGAGGTASLGTGPIGTALIGGSGEAGGFNISASAGIPGGSGAATPFGGSGGGTFLIGAGSGASANTGSGGGGAGITVTGNTGGGGGGAGFVDAIITSPSATYTYTVGASGTAGTAGTTGSTGGAGAAGYIEVTEFYSNLSISGTTSVSANTVFAGPSSGSAANPTFRALVSADLPAVNLDASKSAGNQTSSGSYQDVTGWTSNFDTASAFNTTTGVFTAPTAGKYLVAAMACFASNATGVRSVQIVATSGTFSGTVASASTVDNGLNFGSTTRIISCSANDTIKIQAYQNSGGNLAYDATRTSLSITKTGS